MYGLEPIPRPRGNMRMIFYSFIAGTSELERFKHLSHAASVRRSHRDIDERTLDVGHADPLAGALH